MEEINNKIDELIGILNNDCRIKRLNKLKAELNADKNLIIKVEILKNLNQYSNEYKNIKLELFKNSKFVEYKELENEINILILEINQKLKGLTDTKRCHHESD